MNRWLQPRSRTLIPIAQTGERFVDFSPFVPAISSDGTVAFQASLRTGGSGVYIGRGGAISTLIDPGSSLLAEILSHPAISRDGSMCCYATTTSGDRAVVLVRDGRVSTIASSPGPLGPTMNDSGTVTFRAATGTDGEGIFTARRDGVTLIADTRDRFAAFHGLPVINAQGAVAFRADLKSGVQGVYVSNAGTVDMIAQSGEAFESLGGFPAMNDAGVVVFSATLRAGGAGVFAAHQRRIEPVIDSNGPFETFRGALVDSAGHIVFYATPRGGQLGIFTGPDPEADRVLGLGAPLLGSTVVDFALNPVSINNAGQLAIRIRLADGRQLILRAD